MQRREHWEGVYASRPDSDLGWMQSEPALSVSLIREVCQQGRVIDIGGGTSLLSGRLLDAGYSVAVLDISESALVRTRERIGSRATEVQWIVSDVTAAPALGTFDVWHDRAVFHFLTEPADRASYAALLARTVHPDGHAIIATFATDGPERCSGLPVCRYDSGTLGNELGDAFELINSVRETHFTPRGKPQAFQYSVFRRR